MANARRGLYIRVGYSILRDGIPEDLATVTALTVIFRHICQPNSSVMYTGEKLTTYANTVSATITDTDQVKLASGDYKIEVYYRRANANNESGYEPYVIDAPAFTLTDTSTGANTTTCNGITIQTINLAGEVSFCSQELEDLILASQAAIQAANDAADAANAAAAAAMGIVNSKIDLDGLNSNIRQLKFNTATPVAPTQAGQMAWSDEEKTIALNNGMHTHPIGRETFFVAKNQSGVLIANGKAVYSIGSTGANATIGLATTANSDIAQRTIGIATMDIASNGFGDITTFGEVNDINTIGLTEGALIYLGLNGNLTSVEPIAPTPKISLGLCIRSHLTQGRIAVYVRPIARLNKLTDVYAPNLLDGDVLRWNGTALRYEIYNLVNKADLVGGKVPASQLPAYVDDILEFANFAAFPLVGETSKLYVTLDTNLTYRWSGSAYTEVSKSLAIGITSTTAFRGDWGKIAYDHSQLTNANPHGTTAAQIANTPAGTISATTVQAAINELDSDRVQLETDLNGKINTTDVEQVRSQAINKVPSSKLLDGELTKIINLGALYKGIATPTTVPGTPNGKVFYLTSTNGNYPNFNAISVNVNEIALLIYDSGWTKQTIFSLSKTTANYTDLQLMPSANFRNGGYGYMNGNVLTLTQNAEISYKSGYIILNAGTLDLTGKYRGKYILTVIDGTTTYNLSDLTWVSSSAPSTLSENTLVIGYTNDAKLYSPLLMSGLGNYMNAVLDSYQTLFAYPFSVSATNTFVKNAVKDVIIKNGDRTKNYYFSYVQRHSYNLWRFYLHDGTQVVAGFNTISYTEPEGIDELVLSEMNNSGISGKIWVDWSELIYNTGTGESNPSWGYRSTSNTYATTGLSINVLQLKQVEDVENQINDLQIEQTNLESEFANLRFKTTGKPENFLKTILADRQVVKLAYSGDSIFFSGFGAGTIDGTKGFATLEYNHFASRTLDYLNYNKPTFRGINHTDWTLLNSPVTKNAWSPYNSRSSGIYAVLDTDTKTAQIDGITGNETIVFVFEGGQSGNATYDTGVAEILVSTNGGATWQTPTAAGLKGMLTKYGFGTTKVYESPIDEFDTAFSYPGTAYSPKTDNVGTCPIREVTYQLNSGTTYSFKIQRKSGETSPVNFWGCYYFTGQTIVPINVSWPGASWTNLRQVVYNLLVLTGVDYVITEAPYWHDKAALDTIRTNIDNFINEVQQYGIELAITSCPPGGVITEPFESSLGDEEPSYYPGDNLIWMVNHRKAMNLSAQPTFSDYPEKGATYQITINGIDYVGTQSLTKPLEADYATWVYRQVIVLTFDEAPENPDLINSDYPITLTKLSGNGASELTANSVYYLTPDLQTHRTLVKSQCDYNNVRFIDVLNAYERIAESVGETLETDGYEMNELHPWFSIIDTKARKIKLSTTDGITMPNVGDVFFASIDGTTRQFQVISTNTVNDYIELSSIDGGGENYIYPGDLQTIPNRTSLYNIVYTKVSGTGSVSSFTPIGIYSITAAIMPILMNYMSNYFSRTDGHHLYSNSIDVIFGIIKEQVLKKSIYNE